MKRRSFFRSLIAAPFAASGAVVIAPVLAKPAETKSLSTLAVKIGCDLTEFEAVMTRIGNQLDEMSSILHSSIRPVNDVRAQYGLGPVAGGDKCLVRVNIDQFGSLRRGEVV